METILAIGGAIVLAGNVGAVIFKIIKPSIEIRTRVDELERHDKLDYQSIHGLQELNRMQCKMLLVMIDHMIDGNHVENMQKTRDHIIDMMSQKN